MRWNCPHCGTALAIADQKIDPGWSFSRCYQCAGFSLIKKNNPNLIKLNSAPQETLTAEAVVQTEGQPTQQPPKKVTPPPFPAQVPDYLSQSNLPENKTWLKRMGPMPIAIVVSAAMTVGSGYFLYTQGKKFISKAITGLSRSNQTAEMARPREYKNFVSSIRDNDFIEAIKEGPPSPTEKTAPKQEMARAIHDRIEQKAMAPLRDPSPELIVRLKGEGVKLRSGPGLKYSPTGFGDSEIRYRVKAWKDAWFQIEPVDSVSDGSEASWIHNDFVIR